MRLDGFQENLVLSACPQGTEFGEVTSFRKGYRRYPVRVDVRMPGGEQSVVLKADPGAGKLEREAKLLPVLARLGLPVPKLLAGPAVHRGYSDPVPMVVLSLLPGRTLPFVRATLDELDLTCRLLQEAVARLHGLTDAVRADPMGQHLPEMTLDGALEELAGVVGPWSEEKVFVGAVERLRPALAAIDTPLVFTNGDYNTFNFLCEAGKLTGFLDFSGACFMDPHYGFAAYVVWSIDEGGWGPGRKCGLVERYLYSRNVSQSEFAPRLALRCLQTLQSEISVAEERHAEYREHVLGLLEGCLRWLG